jgi:hypothetical protein
MAQAHPTLRRGAMRIIMVALCVAALTRAGAAAQPSYPLYYDFQIPLALPGFAVTDTATQTPALGGVIPPPGTVNSDDKVQTFYTGTFAGGTLGGLTVRGGQFRYGTGASKSAGGGKFSLTTDAGTVTGDILMTTDGNRTTLLFFGTYLGTRIEFALAAQGGMGIGGPGYAATGLAQTGFASHEAYMAAVQKAVASGSVTSRQQVIAAADTNARLVKSYQDRGH